tara:strand:- start:480 stop:911 length:432 start_codon:yes stop_codon:yes gene_type:complete
MAAGKKKRAVATKVKDVTPKGYGPNEEVEDKFDYKPKKGAVAAPGSGSIAKAKKAKASDVNKSLEQQMAAARTEELEFKVKIKGIPSFYVPAKTAAKVKQSLRKQLKHPDDIVSITRVTKAAQKIDFRLRAQGKGGDGGDKKE